MVIASSYYEDKPLTQVIAGPCTKPVQGLMHGEAVYTRKQAEHKQNVHMVRNAVGPRDLDGRIGELRESIK